MKFSFSGVRTFNMPQVSFAGSLASDIQSVALS
jgi:hypothetical protein